MVASAIIWGTGQLINKQYVKGILLLSAQCILIFTELFTGNYASEKFSIRNDGGFFLRGVWGLVTLGSEPRRMMLAGLTDGDHSIILMIQGIIVVLVLAIILMVYIWNVWSAYVGQKKLIQKKQISAAAKYENKTWESSFHYIILLPSAFLVIFLLLLPVLFSFLIAFTNYARGNLPPTHLLSWVGFRNFVNIIRMPMWSYTFVRVLAWTLVWAVLSTLSCYFAGLFQAVIINNKRVRFKRLWRGIFILPWAIPGFISLLVFRTIFNGQFGPLSQFLLTLV